MFENRQRTIQTDLKISKKMIGQAAALPGQRVSDFAMVLRCQRERNPKSYRQSGKSVLIWDAFKPFKIELSSSELPCKNV